MNFLCRRLGWHRDVYLDSAMFYSALRCGKCSAYLDVTDGHKVDRERELWEQFGDWERVARVLLAENFGE